MFNAFVEDEVDCAVLEGTDYEVSLSEKRPATESLLHGVLCRESCAYHGVKDREAKDDCIRVDNMFALF